MNVTLCPVPPWHLLVLTDPHPSLFHLHPSSFLRSPPESRTKAIDVKLSKMNLATCVTYGTGRRGGWGQATTAALGSFVTQP